MTAPSPIPRRAVLAGAKRLATAAPFLSLIGCDDDSLTSGLTLAGETMGTSYRIKITNNSGVDAAELKREIDGILEGVNGRMSLHRPESELSRFNDSSGSDWMTVSPQTALVVHHALEVGRRSGGAFNVAIGGLVDLWGFGPSGAITRPPSGNRIDTFSENGDRPVLHTRNDPPGVYKTSPHVRADLSGIAKGFAVDLVARHLQRTGTRDYMVEIGGEIRTGGRGPLGIWRVGIENPMPGKRTIHRIVRLDGQAIATSGDYRIFFESQGRRYPHIIDPRSGTPVRHKLASATVIAANAMDADAWSTALMVLGPEDGLALAQRLGLAAFFIVKDGKGFIDRHTTAFTSYLEA